MRLIDADVLLDVLEKLFKRRELNAACTGNRGSFVTWNDAICAIKDAPTVPQWIPVTERLPEYMEPVLTWDGSTYSVEKRITTIRDFDSGEAISGDWWVSDDYVENESDYYPNLRDGACIAWMPLPEPYKED